MTSVIVDDREDVWANGLEQDNNNNGSSISSSGDKEPPPNLLLVQPYHWKTFSGFADINNASGVDLRKRNEKETSSTTAAVETDQQLFWTSNILERLYKRYYHNDDPKQKGNTSNNTSNHRTTKSAAALLNDMRKEVLRNCVLVFSGVIPLHKQHHHPLVRYAKSLGATVDTIVTSRVTHVIASNDGTEKVLAGRRISGCVIVKTSWLMECYWSMTRRTLEPHHYVASRGRVKVKAQQMALNNNGIAKTTAAALNKKPAIVPITKTSASMSDEKTTTIMPMQSSTTTNNGESVVPVGNNDIIDADDDDDDDDDFADELWDG